jgi:hypothetical protein
MAGDTIDMRTSSMKANRYEAYIYDTIDMRPAKLVLCIAPLCATKLNLCIPQLS